MALAECSLATTSAPEYRTYMPMPMPAPQIVCAIRTRAAEDSTSPHVPTATPTIPMKDPTQNPILRPHRAKIQWVATRLMRDMPMKTAANGKGARDERLPATLKITTAPEPTMIVKLAITQEKASTKNVTSRSSFRVTGVEVGLTVPVAALVEVIVRYLFCSVEELL